MKAQTAGAQMATGSPPRSCICWPLGPIELLVTYNTILSLSIYICRQTPANIINGYGSVRVNREHRYEHLPASADELHRLAANAQQQ